MHFHQTSMQRIESCDELWLGDPGRWGSAIATSTSAAVGVPAVVKHMLLLRTLWKSKHLRRGLAQRGRTVSPPCREVLRERIKDGE